jgi:iron complex outermembrane receptor protein
MLLLGLPSVAAAQLGVTAEVERPMARTGGDDPTASATSVDAERRPTELDTLETALLEVPGARPLATGAYGSPTTLALRGADADQLEVLIGELPITSADGGAFDLSTVPLWVLDRVEAYRSGAPTWLGAGGMGGVLRLVPREGSGAPSVGVTLGVGSFGLGHARAAAHVGDDTLSWTTAVGATTSEGDFPYLDDARTALDPSDDLERQRENAWVRDASGLGHLRARVAGGTLTMLLLGHERLGGVPGPASSPTRHARRNETSVLGAVGFELTEGDRRPEVADWRVAVSTAAGFRRRRFTDRFGEVGLLPSVTDDRQWRSVLRVAASGRALPWLELVGVGTWTHEALEPDDALARQPNASSARDAGLLALETRMHGRVGDVRMELRPSARLAVLGSRLTEIRPERSGEQNEGLVVAPTFRLGGALEPLRGLTIAGSVSSATRAPSMIELFGDRGYLRGDTALRPERAESFDLGVVLRGRHEQLTGQAELRGFVTLASDLIRYRRTSQLTAVPENVASATLFGAELGGSLQLGRHAALVGSLSLLDTRTPYLGQDRRLPLRPWLTAYVRPELTAIELGALDRLTAWVDLTHVSDSHLSPANEPGGLLPARTRVGLGVSAHLWEGRLRLDVALRDVLDARGTDLLGFPLPGRSLSVALTVRSDGR